METSQGPASPQGKETSALDNDVLVDGFLALFEECTHDALMKNKPVASFVEKCKNLDNSYVKNQSLVTCLAIKIF